MHTLTSVLGCAVIFVVLLDAFETIILPRRPRRRLRLTRLFYRVTWAPVRALASRIRNPKRREMILSFYGPLSLIALFVVWALALILGFSLLQWAAGSQLRASTEPSISFGTLLYFSGCTLTTLGMGDVVPDAPVARFLAALEGGMGFGFLAMVIGYLPVMYQSFSRRESAIVLLDARAGKPPSASELLIRFARNRALGDLPALLLQWDHWAADVLESHISYPVLCFFRSQHDNESWLGALTAILDASALLIVGVRGASGAQAQLTFAMARHAAVDLAQILFTPPSRFQPDRLPKSELARLRQQLALAGAPLRDGPEADTRLRELRAMYEPYVAALAGRLLIELPPWIGDERIPDNWQTSAWERAARRLAPAEAPDDHA